MLRCHGVYQFTDGGVREKETWVVWLNHVGAMFFGTSTISPAIPTISQMGTDEKSSGFVLSIVIWTQ